ncbi:MAG: PEP-CTERM sorting domain-containing protein [Bacteroidetes bacterium]|nr:PEP-CTERM sorting domain-containing protein [Bacteroidota bacterium]MBU1578793.1 PEP-CTERM sorting domain-containing protein [Bacteroidota bacterium]
MGVYSLIPEPSGLILLTLMTIGNKVKRRI